MWSKRITRQVALLGLLSLFITSGDACVRERDVEDNHRHRHRRPLAKRQEGEVTPLAPLTPEEESLVNSISNVSIDGWSYYYTHGAHVAGTNETMAQWTADRWRESGWQASVIAYNVFLNYPLNKSISMTFANGSVYQPSLEEDVLEADETTSYPNRIPTFHGFSASGSAEAEFVYVGRGQQVDFDRLVELGVPLEGKIAVARYGGPFRGLKVKNSQDHGMLGTIIFTDPRDDGNITEANGYAAYPDGPARNPSSVQRGSVQFLSTYPGDPTTPGYPSRVDSPRSDRFVVMPRIPSIPISYADAIPILAALDGSGTPGADVNRTNWVGALNVTYSTGPAPGTTISMSNFMDEKYTDIWNTIGVINGTNADETLIIGNHRDAWIIGGASDPNSGSAVFVELAKAFGQLLEAGWKPTRNIVLASWDAEEYGLLGSTEWVEEYIPWLTETAISYLNLDGATSGPFPDISGTPDLHAIAIDTMKKVLWRDTNTTMYDVWFDISEGEVGVLGSGSDYTAFLHNGISSIDIGSGGGPDSPVYHYHSNYDSYHWMANFGDPGFLTHKSMAQYLSLLAYNLAAPERLQLDIPNYSTQMDAYYDELLDTVSSSSGELDTSALRSAIDEFAQRVTEVQALDELAVTSRNPELTTVVNHKYRDYQRGFVTQGGLPNRQFFRHLVFAPGIDTGYAATTFPGITEAVEAGNFMLAAEFVQRTADAIVAAANIIKT